MTLEVLNNLNMNFRRCVASKLRNLVKAGEVESARALMDKLKDNGKLAL